MSSQGTVPRSVALTGLAALASLALIAISGTQESNSLRVNEQPSLTALGANNRCTQDTGGTCRMSKCYSWRKHTTCSWWGKCECPKNMCAYQGSCIEPDLVTITFCPWIAVIYLILFFLDFTAASSSSTQV